MHTMQRLFFTAAIMLVLVAVSAADMPQLINYQGVLTSGGSPVTTPVNVIFAIWDAETDGDSLWSEQRTVSPDANGRFSIQLGSVSPIPDSAFAGDAYFSTKVESDPEMIPRSRLVSAGYAYRVGSVDGASGGTILNKLIVTDPGDDSLKINPTQIVIRGPGGDQEAIYAASGMTYRGTGNALTVNDANGDTRVTISVDQSGGSITLYETPTISKFNGTSAGGRKMEIGEGGVIIFGASETDTTLRLFPNGNVIGRGQLTMGKNSTGAGQWSTVLGFNNTASGDSSVVCGGYNNIASGRVATVGGGAGNEAIQNASTISGGIGNTADGWTATIGGGFLNTASMPHATVAGGRENDAIGQYSFVGGGENNIASGVTATVPGGRLNKALGDQSLAAGANARASHRASVVIAANSSALISDSVRSGGIAQMVLRADGGIYLTNTAELAPYDNAKLITTRGGAYLAGTGTNWENASDRNIKENFTPIDREELLAKIAALPITRWNYKEDDPDVRHIGPVAQDFNAMFGVGSDGKSISTIDPAGIALAAIQELYRKTQKIEQLEGQMTELQKLVKRLLAERQ